MRSLAHNTLRGRRACWSSGMGLGRIDKLIHSHGPAHNPHKMVSAQLEHLWCQDQPRTTRTPKTHHGPDLGEAITFPLYSILCDSPRDLHPNDFSLPGLPGFPRGSPEIPPCGTPGTLKPHNFASRPRIEVRSEEKLQLSSRAFKRYVARRLQPSILGRFPTFSGLESKLADSREFDSRPFFWS